MMSPLTKSHMILVAKRIFMGVKPAPIVAGTSIVFQYGHYKAPGQRKMCETLFRFFRIGSGRGPATSKSSTIRLRTGNISRFYNLGNQVIFFV